MQTLQKRTSNVRTKPLKPPTQNNKLARRDSTYVIGELEDLLSAAQANQQIISKVQLFSPKQYTMYNFTKWRDKYPAINRVQHLSKKIEEVLESNIIHQGLTRNPAFPIFLLKNHYGYQDKREVETNNNYVFNVTRGLPTERKKAILAKRAVIDAEVVKNTQGS